MPATVATNSKVYPHRWSSDSSTEEHLYNSVVGTSKVRDDGQQSLLLMGFNHLLEQLETQYCGSLGQQFVPVVRKRSIVLS
jgi:hypothetical protein